MISIIRLSRTNPLLSLKSRQAAAVTASNNELTASHVLAEHFLLTLRLAS